jgi:predicted transcriptional regulator
MKVLNADQQDRDQLITVAKALGSEQRLRILDYLQTRAANVSEIAEALAMPLSTANLHLNLLAEAGLIYTETVSARRGVQKLCARSFDVIVLHLPLDQTQQRPTHESIQLSMPVGAFVSQAVLAPCGLAGAERLIGLMDDPRPFTSRSVTMPNWSGLVGMAFWSIVFLIIQRRAKRRAHFN